MIISSTPGLQWAQSYLNRLAALASPPTITATQRNALFKLLSDIDTTIGISKFKAIYPFLGGDANSHTLNAISSSFKITWSGNFTHNSNGVEGDGSASSGYGDLGGTPSQLFNGQNSAHVSAYFNEAISTTCVLAGVTNGANGESIIHFTPANPSVAFGLNSGWTDAVWNPSDPLNVAGTFWSFSRANPMHKIYKNGIVKLSQGTIPKDASPINNRNMYFLASNISGTVTNRNPTRCAFASFGGDLTADDHANLYKAVLAYQTALGRSV